MDHEQLWETTMNPQTRYLKQIEIEDAILASKTTELLMGNNAENRREFIQENAVYANLDI
jgi:DNA gyrase subunit B